MNLLAAQAELETSPSMWVNNYLALTGNDDRNVVDTIILEFPQRMRDLAGHMCGIYKEIWQNFLSTL